MPGEYMSQFHVSVFRVAQTLVVCICGKPLAVLYRFCLDAGLHNAKEPSASGITVVADDISLNRTAAACRVRIFTFVLSIRKYLKVQTVFFRDHGARVCLLARCVCTQSAALVSISFSISVTAAQTDALRPTVAEDADRQKDRNAEG